MIERRQRHIPLTRVGYIEQLPAITVLDRLPIAVIGVGLCDGAVIYTNPAAADLLGYPSVPSLNAQSLSSLMTARSITRPGDCVTELNSAHGVITEWNHADGYPIRTMTSRSILVRDDDPVLLVGLVDITELCWNSGRSDSLQSRCDAPTFSIPT